MSSDNLIITGTGRVGTTFLIQLFRALGEDTGGHDEIFREVAASERDKDSYQWPRVIKGTAYIGMQLRDKIKRYDWNVSHVFFCLRNIESTIISMKKQKRGKGVYKHLSNEEFEKRIEIEVPQGFKEIREELKKTGIPYTEIWFPKSAQDREYCYSVLSPVLPYSKEEYYAAWEKSVKPEKIRNG